MMGEIRNFPSKPSTAEELAAAKEASMRSLPGRFETTGAVARALDEIFLNDRALDYFANLPANIGAHRSRTWRAWRSNICIPTSL